ncbi:hypothetical protein EPK99_16860 [Neorhizobium lilium]|uniref:Uncharacterized protein n=1 Tax=Neorhizobium lilium TaxID=2503024 RepID=A0A444LGW9_9HYPH|nr:hypothetical protein [Neorhizobium lilium]RWX77303.1 hypothetical protein EPK99_16860 [Neorhizobium lilium]
MSLAGISLPDRPVSVRKDVISKPRGYAFLTLFMFAIAAFLAAWQGPDLLQDIQISKNPLVLEDGDIQNGRCTTRKAVLTDCEARLVYTREGRQYQKYVHLFFVDLHVGDYESGMVVSADHPELATLTIGLDKLWNRIISLAAMILIVAGIGVGMIFVGFRVGQARRRLRHPAMLTAVPVEIAAFNRNRRGLFVTYADKLSSRKTNRTAYTHFAAGEEPLIIGTTADGNAKGKDKAKAAKAVGLAVRHGTTPLPVLLDSRLERLDLTEVERRAILDPIEAALAPTGGMIVLREPKRMPRILRGVLVFLAVILLCVAGLLGYWLWYVTSSKTQFNQVGMEVNNVLPAPMNRWGCGELKKRFGSDRAPYGCVAADFTSWK